MRYKQVTNLYVMHDIAISYEALDLHNGDID